MRGFLALRFCGVSRGEVWCRWNFPRMYEGVEGSSTGGNMGAPFPGGIWWNCLTSVL